MGGDLQGTRSSATHGAAPMAGKRDQSQLTSRPEFLALLSSRPSSLSAPGASCRPASGTHDRGRPDAPAEYHLRGPRTLSTDNLVHGTGQCSGCERSYGKRSATDLHGQCSPASSRRSSADGDGSPTGGDGSPADGSPADGSPTDGDGSPTDGDGSSANGDGSSRAGTYRPIPSAPGGCVDESIDLRADSGAIGEHLAQKKNPRIQMGQAPQMMQAPVAQAPVAPHPKAPWLMLPWVMALLLQHLKGSWVTWPSPVEGLLRAMAMATASVLLQARDTGQAPAIRPARPIHRVLPKATRRVPRLSRPRLRVLTIGGEGTHSTIPVLNSSSHRMRPRNKGG